VHRARAELIRLDAPTAAPPLPLPPPSPLPRDAGVSATAAAYFFAHSADLLCVVRADGTLGQVNPAFARTSGWSPDGSRDPAAAAFAAFVHPDDRAALATAWTGVVSGRAAEGLVLRLRSPDGATRWISWHLSAPDVGGLVHGIGRDVTEREASAYALRESEARYEHIAANVPGVVYQFVFRPDGTSGYTFVSEGARALFGVAPEAALADPAALIQLVHPDDLAEFRALARQTAATLGDFHWEGRVVLGTGEERFFQVAARDYRQPDGTIVSDGLMIDITALHRAAQRLEESEQRYRSLFEHNPDAVYSFDLDMRFTSANPACEDVSGYSETEFIAGAASPIVVPEDRDLAHAGFRAATEGRATRFDVGIRHRSGSTVRLGITNVPIVVRGRVVGVFGIAKDISTQRALEERLRQAQKMEAVGKLAGGIAHDFNNLLMVIQSYGGFLTDELPEGTTARADLAEMLRAAGRAQELTRQLLAFGRKQVLRPRGLDVNRKVANVAGMLRRIIGEDITLVTELEPAPWAVIADPGQLEQVLMNLAVNARDAMPKGGQLHLRTENRVVRAPAASFPAPAERRYVALVVEDAGVGIPDEVLPRIFEPFYTTKSVGHGTGLGLATVYGIVEQSGGFVTVDSVPGSGSRFTVMLPAVDSTTAPAPASGDEDRASLPAGAESILLVEDEAEVRSAVRRMLERLGYAVREASTGAEALRIVDAMSAARAGRIDLVLTDLVMPELGGHALGEQLAAQHPDIQVLYMSGYTDDEIFRRGLAGAGGSFLEKPFTAARLAHAVRQALEGRAAARG
jgi:two-component system cell cycle sensor histidine kinase/response regulator CckA